MSTKTRGHHHSGHASNAEMTEEPAEKPAPARQKVSEEERSRLIQVRAYSLWEHAGKPDGDAAREQFWCEAEKEIMASHASNE
jgi:Protein of unknown function (DUF2934)